jgi:17beta-estradiol 17-dehydrogenase/3alpha(17beta)-hydroxysteroid dehydrogenase (NAD+)
LKFWCNFHIFNKKFYYNFFKGQCNYAPSKAGVECLTRVAAKEFAKYGIRANTVVCGFTHTPMTENVPDKVKTIVMQQIALKRFAEPEGIFFYQKLV